MKTTISTLIFLTLVASLLVGCTTAAAGPMQISEGDAGKTIELKTGDVLVVSLEGNITTGYNWVPAPQSPELLKQVGETEITPTSDLVGAPGQIVLRFEAVAAGQTVLHLDYKRPWETNNRPEKTFEVTVVVK